jgi:hypothetical protein
MGCAPSPVPVVPTAGFVSFRIPHDADVLRRLAAEDEAEGAIRRRTPVVAAIHRGLLMSPPRNEHVAELFDVLSVMAGRADSGEIREARGAYVYTTYERDLERDRPDGLPRRDRSAIEVIVRDHVEHYHLQAAPAGPGSGPRDPAVLEPTWRGRSERPRAGSRGY